MKVLITGITGMVGSHLAEYFLSSFPEIEVHGLVRWRSPLRNIQGILPRITLHQGDLRDLNSLVVLLRKVKPDRIHHLAAQSYVDMSFVAPADTLNSNIIGTVNLLDAIRIVGINPRIHICSSSEVYGQVRPDEVPITEHTPLRPASPYAVSKVGEDMIAFQYGLSYELDLVRTRMFTHTGPRRGDVFAESSFARQIAEIEASQQKRTGSRRQSRQRAHARRRARRGAGLQAAARQMSGRRGLQHRRQRDDDRGRYPGDAEIPGAGADRARGRSGAAAAVRRDAADSRHGKFHAATGWTAADFGAANPERSPRLPA